MYGPAFSAYIADQNLKIAKNASELTGAIPIHLDTLGLVNTFIDGLIQVPLYLEMAHNNTYNLSRITETAYRNGKANFTQLNGCRDQVTKCQDLAANFDRKNVANNASVNAICSSAYIFCANNIQGTYLMNYVSLAS
jgi:hypothetical protein